MLVSPWYVGTSLPICVADSSPTVLPDSSNSPKPAGFAGCPVSSPATNTREPSGAKHTWPLMSRPSGSSSVFRMTVCFSIASPVE